VPSTAASIRTTTAATMLKGSSKSNILPTQATAVVNFRILPGDSVEFIKTRIKEIISDERVEIEAYMVNEPSQVSSTDSYGYRLIEKTVRALDQDVLVAPYLVQGGTDAKHFYGLSNNIYRFMMVKLTPETMKRFHGVNEQLAQQDYIKAVQFFYEVLLESAKRPEM
jgi:carboxypeptidase PM20D1